MRLLLDEMYSPTIARQLRERGHDVVSAGERADLRGTADSVLFEAMCGEGRVIVTNNVRDFAPLAAGAGQTGTPFPGLLFTSDRSLPRTIATIGRFVDLLDGLLRKYERAETIAAGIEWVTDT